MEHNHKYPPPLRPDQCPAYILAGGRSSRFGSDKARVQLNDKPLLLVLRHALIEQGHTVEIVADRAERYADFGIQCLVDWRAEQGPLAGVAAALKHREQQRPGWLLLLSCDLLVWRSTWFAQLAGILEQRPLATAAESTAAERAAIMSAGEVRQELDAVAFRRRNAGGEPQAEPFPSLLHSRLGPQAIALLDRQRRALQSLFAEARTATIDAQDNPQAWTFNTVERFHALKP